MWRQIKEERENRHMDSDHHLQDENNNCSSVDDRQAEGFSCFVDSFCRENLFIVLQRRTRWLFPDSTTPVEQELFKAFLRHCGFKSKENFLKKMSKKKRERRLSSFDFQITHWLRSRYPTYSPFVMSETINYDSLQLSDLQIARQRELGTPNGFETEVEFSPFPNNCAINREALMECDDECKNGKCTNKESISDFDWRKLMELRHVSKEVGAGVIAIVVIPRGTFLGLVTGEALSITQTDIRKDGPNRDYLFSTDPESTSVVAAFDPKQYGNHTRFFNHCCAPNCHFQTWLAQQKWICKFYTTREVQEVSDLIID